MKAEITPADETDDESGGESDSAAEQSGESNAGKGCGANAGSGFTLPLAAVAAIIYVKEKNQKQ